MPLVSIITVNLNNASGLARTIQSVAEQDFAGSEHVVVDGGSRDGSLTVIGENEARLARWISEPDTGIYDAMNKGIAMATGDYLIFINSGDHFFNSTALSAGALEIGDADLHYFDLEVVRDSPHRPYIKTYPDQLRASYFFEDTLPHPATFIRASLFRRHGLYDHSLKICADWKQFLLWVGKHGCSYRHHRKVLSSFRFDGLSSQPASKDIIARERESVFEKEFGWLVDDLEAFKTGRVAVKTLGKLRISGRVRLLLALGILPPF